MTAMIFWLAASGFCCDLRCINVSLECHRQILMARAVVVKFQSAGAHIKYLAREVVLLHQS